MAAPAKGNAGSGARRGGLRGATMVEARTGSWCLAWSGCDVVVVTWSWEMVVRFGGLLSYKKNSEVATVARRCLVVVWP